MTFRSLDTLGLAGVPVLDPLSYPGRPVPWPALLRDDGLLALEPTSGPVGRWRTSGPEGGELDAVLRESGAAPVADRMPVVAVGSNGSPGQVRHKLLAAGLPVVVPMVPVVVDGVGAGVSAHISAPGYVGAAPYAGPVRGALAVGWLDEAQLAAVDATEPNYRRLRLAPRFTVTLPDGAVLPEAWLYVGRHGVLSLDGGAPRSCGDQRALLRDLLAGSGRLRELLGPGPREWVTRAAADPEVRIAGARVFADHGWVRRDPWPRDI